MIVHLFRFTPNTAYAKAAVGNREFVVAQTTEADARRTFTEYLAIKFNLIAMLDFSMTICGRVGESIFTL